MRLTFFKVGVMTTTLSLGSTEAINLEEPQSPLVMDLAQTGLDFTNLETAYNYFDAWNKECGEYMRTYIDLSDVTGDDKTRAQENFMMRVFKNRHRIHEPKEYNWYNAASCDDILRYIEETKTEITEMAESKGF